MVEIQEDLLIRFYLSLPEWAKLANDDMRKYMISGYLDSDGSAFYDRGKLRVNFTSVNLGLLESIQDILLSTGISNTITRHNRKSVSIFNGKEYISKESYRLSISRNSIKKIIPAGFEHRLESEKMKRIIDEKISSVVKTGDKAVISSCGKYIYLPIVKIEKSKYTGTVYNFECETHTYMCRNITSHNCDPLTT
jgi:intein/homing endonuclease